MVDAAECGSLSCYTLFFYTFSRPRAPHAPRGLLLMLLLYTFVLRQRSSSRGGGPRKSFSVEKCPSVLIVIVIVIFTAEVDRPAISALTVTKA